MGIGRIVEIDVSHYPFLQLRTTNSNSDLSSERGDASSASGSRNEVSSSTSVAGIRITEKDAKLIGEHTIPDNSRSVCSLLFPKLAF